MLDITLINVVLQNDDDDLVLIPNSVIFSTMVLNQSKQNIKKLTIEFELDLKYQSSPDELEQSLKGVLRPFASNITENSFSLKIRRSRKTSCITRCSSSFRGPTKKRSGRCGGC